MSKLYECLSSYDSILISSRPGMGNSTLAVNFIASFLEKSEKRVVVFGLKYGCEGNQLSGDFYNTRLHCRISGESFCDLMGDYENRGARELSFNHRRVVNKRAVLYTPNDIYSGVMNNTNVGLVVIDAPFVYDELLKEPLALCELCDVICWLRSRGIKLVVCEYLSREVEVRKPSIPVAQDFGERGKLFDTIISLHRARYHTLHEDVTVSEALLFEPTSDEPYEVPVDFDYEHQAVTEKTILQ